MQSRSHASRSDIAKEVEEDVESEQSILDGSDDGEEPELDENSEDSCGESIEVWRANKRNLVPLFYFTTNALDHKDHKLRHIGKKYCMSFRMVNECKIVRQIFVAHGFRESHPGDYDFNLMWTGKHLKAEVIRSFYKHQRINHFPRTYELTRKDRLYKNVQKMQETKGFRNFDIVPTTFIMPQEFVNFSSCFCREGGIWIVKPVASSRGRGIFLVSHPDQVPTDEAFVVSRYLTNPLLIDGYKFDIRLYVVVTSFDPLVIYLYEEGLARFATVKFDKTTRHIGNHFMHLTNYSVNKRSLSFVQNSDPDVEDQGFKWTLGALLRRLRSMGKDIVTLMMKIEDAIVKTIISGETQISAACRMYVPYKENCFEVFGFDVIIDENMKPWILEVNLSPSLACDSPLDLKVKSHMICDMFNLVGLPCSDEVYNQVSTKASKSTSISNISKQLSNSTGISQRPHSGIKILRSSRIRPSSAAVSSAGGSAISSSPLSAEERQSIRRIREESQRAGGFIRLFPREDSWDLYGSFFDSHASFNATVLDHLYGDQASMNVKSKSESMANYSLLVLRQNTLNQQSSIIATAISSLQRAATVSGSGSAAEAYQRAKRYERSLPRNGQRIRPPPPSRQSQGSNSRSGKSSRPSTATVSGKNATNSTSNQNLTTIEQPMRSSMDVVVPQYKPQIVMENHDAFRLNNHAKVQLHPDEKMTLTSPRNVNNISNNNNNNNNNHVFQAPPPVPPPPPTLPNLLSDIENGCSLSVTQARSAFTRYLELVRTRLLTPLSNSATPELQEAEAQNLDLVVRFMRRAAVNLSESVKITPPSKRLGLEDQRIFVANQMTDFLRIYKKDTFLLPNEDGGQQHSARSQHSNNANSNNSNTDSTSLIIEPAKLNEYLGLVTEPELEKFLTHYTKVKKSASIFLGSPLSNSAANAKSNRPSTAIMVSGQGTLNGSRPSTSLGEAAQNNFTNYTTHVWTTNSNGQQINQQAENEDDLASHPDVAMLPEGIVIRSDGRSHHQTQVNHRPPMAPNSGRASTNNHRPMSSASTMTQATNNGGNSRTLNSSLAAAVAVYTAPVRPPLPQNNSGTTKSNHNHIPPAKAPVDNSPALATSAYLRWSSSAKGSLNGSASDAILNAALQRIALKYSSSSGGKDGRRLSHSGSLNSLANSSSNGNIAAPVQFSVADSNVVNSRAAIATASGGGNNNNLQQTQQQQHTTIRTRPQSASVSMTGPRPPLPNTDMQQQPSRRSRPLIID